jgi:NAD(P)-dependent dehydrogenase (short-subunit alcohol dehydrogenase family)
VLDPRSELKAVLAGDTDPLQVVSLLGLRARAFGKETRAAATEIVPLLELIREVAAAGSARLWIVTRGAQPIEADSPADAIWQAPLWGIGRTVAVEHPEIYGGLIDLDPNGSTADLVEPLWRHLRAPGGQDQVALRGGRRLAARLERYQPPESKLPLRADGAYLVTGGLAGLGLEVARWLVQNGARRLVLASRSALPPRAQWTALAPDHPHAPHVAALRALEAAGAAVHPVTLDVAEPEAVADFVRQYRAEGWPPLRGVVHAAGILNHHTLSELGPAELEDVLRPKLGAWLLHRELEAFPLDFFVMFSSASAVLSSPKLGGYAAANAFLDAVAAYRTARGLPAISIDWGVWSEAGMAARVDARSVATLVGRGMGAMTTAQGLDALGRLLAVPDAQVAVLPVDWQRWGELYPAFTAAPFFEELFRHRTAAPAPASSDSGPAHAVLTAGEAQRLPRLREYLTTVVAGILGFAPDDLADDLPINRLGLDSLTAVELKNRIAAELRVTLPTVRFLQGPSVTELAQEIAPHLERSQPNGESAEPETAGLLGRVDELSDAEVDAALLRLLDGRSAP